MRARGSRTTMDSFSTNHATVPPTSPPPLHCPGNRWASLELLGVCNPREGHVEQGFHFSSVLFCVISWALLVLLLDSRRLFWFLFSPSSPRLPNDDEWILWNTWFPDNTSHIFYIAALHNTQRLIFSFRLTPCSDHYQRHQTSMEQMEQECVWLPFML